MNHKPLFIASTIVTVLAAMALEGGGLSAGQAIAVAAPAGVLAMWSFRQTDWREPHVKGGEKNENSIRPDAGTGLGEAESGLSGEAEAGL